MGVESTKAINVFLKMVKSKIKNKLWFGENNDINMLKNNF